MRFAGDAMSGDYVNAGSSGKDSFATTAKKSPNYGTLGNISMAEQSKEKQSAMFSAGKVAGAGIESLGAVTAAGNGAQAELAAAESQASATKFGGMMDMFGGLGGAAIGKFGSGGGWKDATDIGFAGNQVNDLGRIRY